MLEEMRRLNAEKPRPKSQAHENDIVIIFAKIKAKIVRERIQVSVIL